MPGLVVLTGFRATGKTVVGRALARLLDCRFVDTDALVTERLGCSIADSVQLYGWQPFRDFEREVLQECASGEPMVVATGGGAVLHEQEWRRMRGKGVVIWLRTGVETLVSRLQADQNTEEQRPALGGRDAVEEIPRLLAEREPLYLAGSDLVVQTEDATPDELAAAIYQFVRQAQENDPERS